MQPRSKARYATVAAIGAVVLSSCNLAERDDEGNIVGAGNVGAQNVQIGDCYNDPDGTVEGEEFEVNSVDAVPCSDSHDNEVYALYDLPDGDFPGEDEVVTMSFDGCIERFADFVGGPYENSTLDVGILYPVADTWEDDKEVVCSVYDPVGQVTGSLEGQVDAYRFAVEGECMDEDGLVTDCETEHYAEIYHEVSLEGEEYPGETAVDEEAFALCQDAYADYVGVDWESSALDFVYWTPDEASWDNGYTLVSCAVIDPAGALSGSVQGSAQ